MINSIRKFSKFVFTLHRYVKRVIALSVDAFLCFLCTWIAFVIRLEELILFENYIFYSALYSAILALPIFWISGMYRTIFRYTSLSIILNIFKSILIYGLLFSFVISIHGVSSYSKNFEFIPRSIGIIQPMLLFFAIITSRLIIKYFLFDDYYLQKNNKKNVLIYGAGNAGRQLLEALEVNFKFNVMGFLDDNKDIQRQVLLNKVIYSPDKLENLIKSKNIELILIALPSISRSKRNRIIEKLSNYKLSIKTLPSISEVIDGRITISDIKDFNINDLLNRDEVKPDLELLNKNIESRTVAVSGAGGSIGSELCRQILRLNPKKLLLLELNEFALYELSEKLKKINNNIKIIPLLINIQDQKKLEKIFKIFNVETIYHAAAYKHVALVEENICAAIQNNVYGTLSIATASASQKISNFVLISSDKAVRPTNIMGATKRLSELCVQAIKKKNLDVKTNFSIVRFGNVLESSGSVIPKFKDQIKEGGPVTLTHPDVTRYFMTVTEAAQLVIQAGAMGTRSEIFVLDMGESVKIKDLICQMINLSGFTIRDNKNVNGDIEIQVTGLRAGEKLYEELLIGNNPQKTSNPKIMKIDDPYIPYSKLKKDLDELKIIIEENEAEEAKTFLKKVVKSYQSNSKNVDHTYIENFL